MLLTASNLNHWQWRQKGILLSFSLNFMLELKEGLPSYKKIKSGLPDSRSRLQAALPQQINSQDHNTPAHSGNSFLSSLGQYRGKLYSCASERWSHSLILFLLFSTSVFCCQFGVCCAPSLGVYISSTVGLSQTGEQQLFPPEVTFPSSVLLFLHILYSVTMLKK